jgi:hypothetical protein
MAEERESKESMINLKESGGEKGGMAGDGAKKPADRVSTGGVGGSGTKTL